MQQVPSAARTGDKELLTDAQRESLAIFRRFNISQPQLRGQVILAKVLRATPKHLLVDPGYYGMNVVPRQVRTHTSGYQQSSSSIASRMIPECAHTVTSLSSSMRRGQA